MIIKYIVFNHARFCRIPIVFDIILNVSLIPTGLGFLSFILQIEAKYYIITKLVVFFCLKIVSGIIALFYWVLSLSLSIYIFIYLYMHIYFKKLMYVNAMSIKNHVHFPYKYISELYSSVSVCAFVKDTRLKFGIYLKFTIAESLKYRCIYVYMIYIHYL